MDCYHFADFILVILEFVKDFLACIFALIAV